MAHRDEVHTFGPAAKMMRAGAMVAMLLAGVGGYFLTDPIAESLGLHADASNRWMDGILSAVIALALYTGANMKLIHKMSDNPNSD